MTTFNSDFEPPTPAHVIFYIIHEATLRNELKTDGSGIVSHHISVEERINQYLERLIAELGEDEDPLVVESIIATLKKRCGND